MEFITKDSIETVRLGVRLAKLLEQGDCICLVGELGSGKTTFVQGIGKGFGIKGNMMSPTFVLVREYSEKNFFHLDLYRIRDKEFIESGLNQYMSRKNICAIEWAEKIRDFWPKKYIRIEFRVVNENMRKINFLPHGRNLKLSSLSG
jgi:tRNA threonylcarbamoyladenosine biosynthesis protein TsaE